MAVAVIGQAERDGARDRQIKNRESNQEEGQRREQREKREMFIR